MKRSAAYDVIYRQSESFDKQNSISAIQAAESLHELATKQPSLRDYFAAMAMQSLIARGGVFEGTEVKAYEIADAMLKARE
jgi:hypothetical protein